MVLLRPKEEGDECRHGSLSLAMAVCVNVSLTERCRTRRRCGSYADADDTRLRMKAHKDVNIACGWMREGAY